MNKSERDIWIERFLAEAEISRLESVSVPVSPNRSFGLVSLLKGWHSHVIRIRGEVDLPDTDTTIWGAHDLIASLHLRTFLARGLEKAEPGLPGGFKRALNDVDSRFRVFTECDEYGAVRRIDGGDHPREEWWWDRIPYIGPIRREIDRIEQPQ